MRCATTFPGSMEPPWAATELLCPCCRGIRPVFAAFIPNRLRVRSPLVRPRECWGPTSLIGSLQAMEAIKVLSGRASAVRRTIFRADLWKGPLRETGMPARDPDCPTCGRREFPFLDGGRAAPVSLCGRNAVQIHERRRPLSLSELAGRLHGLGSIRRNEFALRFDDGQYEMTIFPDGRAIVKGTTDPGVARSVYARYLG